MLQETLPEIGSADWFERTKVLPAEKIRRAYRFDDLAEASATLCHITRTGSVPNFLRKKLALEAIRYCRVGLLAYSKSSRAGELIDTMADCAIYAPELSEDARNSVVELAKRAAIEAANRTRKKPQVDFRDGFIRRVTIWQGSRGQIASIDQ